MIPVALVGKSALGFFKNHWGKIIAGVFVLAWGTITYGMYGANQELNQELGAASAAISVCVAERNNMDNVLTLLKADIALIQADNDKYKQKVKDAERIIWELGEAVPVIITEIDTVVLPESCEGTMDWMLTKALNR